ncbi:bile acid:Na+ symporter family protein [Medicago truncatula]|uniref:Bile acid:Na+ symporter family protein n=1 Tax=Medicago truncatula TaxID=3880 RepID=A0A072VA14_MEDTR|nr:bile acid:Na+ symporter family protein [Medicago truncatula]
MLSGSVFGDCNKQFSFRQVQVFSIIINQVPTVACVTYYAPALRFLMFAVEVNSSKENFIEAFNRPVELVTAYVGQFVMKPLGYLLCIISVNVFGIPTAIGAGIVLLTCVSGVQICCFSI